MKSELRSRNRADELNPKIPARTMQKGIVRQTTYTVQYADSDEVQLVDMRDFGAKGKVKAIC